MHSPPALAPAVLAARPGAVAFAGLTFRSIHLRHFARFSRVRPLFAAGGGGAGSRYVPPHGPPVLYAALDLDTAHREGNQPFYQTAATPAGPALVRAGGLRPDPVVVIGVFLRAARLLDLRDRATRRHLGIRTVAACLGR